MLIDHIGAILLPGDTKLYLIARCIGRIAFPIFAFLIVEGFHHTSDVKNYLKRLGTFALISEIPFDLAFYGSYFSTEVQNVFFTLFLGLLAIYLMSLAELKNQKKVFVSALLDMLILLGFCAIAVILRTDYNMMGILMIAAFHLFRGSKLLLTLSLFILSSPAKDGQVSIQILATLAMIPISFYNGKKGKSMKYFFYAFYPAHILILYLISRFL